MSFDVVFRFAGLCAHVPNASLDGGAVSMMRVVMPQAENPEEPVIPHYPALIVNTEDLDGGADLLAQSGAAAGNSLVISLARKELTLLPVTTDGLSRPLSLESKDPDLDFRRIPRLDVLVPASKNINPSCLLDEESRDLVVARVVLEHGNLLGTGAKVHPMIHFDQEAPAQYAHEVTLTLSGLESLTMYLRDLDAPAQRPQALVLRRLAGGQADVRLGNYCGATWLKEMWGVWPPDEVPGDDGMVRDCDFEAFYWIGDPVPPPERRPVPTWDPAGADGHASCHQAVFAPVP